MVGMGRLLGYLLQLIFVFFLLRFFWKLLRRLIVGVRMAQQAKGRRSPPPFSDASEQTFRDPVCGMFVSPELSHKLKSSAETLHFCSAECLEKYQAQRVQ